MSEQPAFDYGVAASAVESLGEAVAEARERLNLSLRGLASVTGISFATVRRIEQGHGFDSSSAIALMRWMDRQELPPRCTKPPAGWWCSRVDGHFGPCAARLEADHE